MTASTSRERSLRGTINAADLCVSEEDYEQAERALLAALGYVRKAKAGGADE